MLSSHKSENSSDGDCTRCNANEQTTISMMIGLSTGSPVLSPRTEVSAPESETLPNEVRCEMGEGRAPPAMSMNERGAQGNVVRSRYASAVY